MRIMTQDNAVMVDKGVGPSEVRLKKSQFSEYIIETPDPHITGVWVYENSSEFVIGLDELGIAKMRSSETNCLNEVFDCGLIAVKMTLAQTPLSSTVLRGVYGLSGQVRLRLKNNRSLEESLEKQEPLLFPVPGSADQFLDFLIEKYREKTRNIETAIVLFSGGWDSRLELALVRAALPKGARIVLAHVRTNSDEEKTVKAIAEKTNLDIVIADADKLLQYGLAWPTIMSAVRSESTWRPTVPVYGTLMALLRAQYDNSFAFGFSPFPLKGRDYDREVGPSAPQASRVRMIHPPNDILAGMNCSSNVYQDVQQTIWASLLSGTEDWTLDQQQDWLNWNAYYAQGYAHRVRSLHAVQVDPIYAHSDVVARFMGLPEQSKRGTLFIEYALKRLMPEIEGIPILASSGDVSRGTDKLGGSFTDSQKDALSREVFSFRSDGPTQLFSSEVARDPMQQRMAVWKMLMKSEGQFDGLAKQVLEVGGASGGHYDLNATQIADFILRSSGKSGA